MSYIPHTDDDVRQMLAAIGAGSIEDLFDEIPSGLKIEELAGIPAAMSEMEVGRLIRESLRKGDHVCRMGGEEFVVLARSTGKTEAIRLAERIRESIAGLEIPIADHSIHVTLSLGVAALPDVAPEGGPNELLALADARLYKAKAAGKNRVCAEGE